MAVNLKGRSFLTLKDYAPEEIEYLIDLAKDLKEKKKKGIFEMHMKHKMLRLFLKSRLPVHAVLLLLDVSMKVHTLSI